MKHWLERRWYAAPGSAPVWLRPLAALYGAISLARRRRLQAAAIRLPVPVIVVGNISVGGTGKTPLVIALVELLRSWGWSPGVVSRGYGGHAPRYPWRVDAADGDPAQCGDEPLLIAQRTGCPVVVAPDRVAAARQLLPLGVDIIVSDDGLQHYRLARDVEICVVDGGRGLGNQALLPAGPLRETPARLAEVDLVVVNGGGWRTAPCAPIIDMALQLDEAWALAGGARRALDSFVGVPVHAVAGIGNPERFFAALEAHGLRIERHVFADHHRYRASELRFADGAPVLMTEKDAIKCRAFADLRYWAVPVQARIGGLDQLRMRECIAASCRSGGT